MQNVIDEMLDYIKVFIEQPNEAFGGMPVCPFASKVRREQRIDFQVGPFSLSDESSLLQKIDEFKNNPNFDIIIFIHPDKKGLTFEELDKVNRSLNEILTPDFVAFEGHPDDPFMANGIYTRRDPYPNIQVIAKSTLDAAEKKMLEIQRIKLL